MDMIVHYFVVFGKTATIAPMPANGNTGVPEITDITMCNVVIPTMPYPDTHRTLEIISSGLYDTIVNINVLSMFLFVFTN